MRATIAILACLALLAGCTRSPYEPPPDPVDLWHVVVLSEIVSDNSSIIADEFGDFDDYIEIYNPQDTTVNISGFGLTDDVGAVKFEFPYFTIIEPDMVLLIWCDAEPEEGDYHADFRISADGEWIGLYDVYGSIIDSVTVPELPEDSAFVRDSVWSWTIGAASPGSR